MAAAHLKNLEIYIEQRCSKVPMGSRRMALTTAKQLKKVNSGVQSSAGKLNVYRCGVCRSWHIGHRS